MTMKSLHPAGRDRLSAFREGSQFVTLPQGRFLAGDTRSWSGGSVQRSSGMELGGSAKGIEFTVELPGLEENDRQVGTADNALMIRGAKKAMRGEQVCHVVGRSYGSFVRTVELPGAGAIKADISKGVLKISVAKPAPAQAKPALAQTRTTEIEPAA
jgi:HSP20 family protein